MTNRDKIILARLIERNGPAIVTDAAIRNTHLYGTSAEGCKIQDAWQAFLDHTSWCDDIQEAASAVNK